MRFDQTYNQGDFLKFLGDFLPDDFVEKEEDIVIKDRYKEITKAKSLAFCESLDIHVLEMEHSHENDPRIAIATDAFKILADHWIHKALVIFKSNNSDNYRFSYLTISLDVNERNKVVKRYSNARRYSFYLGPSAKVRTPEQQLTKKGRVKDIEDLLSRFSVEVVNKQFYLEVAKYFDELVSNEGNNLALPSVSQENVNIRKSFAVRLIGRLMFCWFLKQKKSDFGQLIPDELLSSNVVSENYYHSILEPLFFEVLNTSIDTRGIRNELFDKVPYLNGGLFNPQYDDYYDLDRGTFTSKHINTLRISDTWFRDFFGLLETYNFTIDENTVFDQELSVDPEMLGRIFENLLAEINPETGSSERKRTGSFYTPRQIVEYMVDQSLIEFLKTKTSLDEKKLSALVSYDLTDDTEHPLGDNEKQSVINAIESLKLLDPACGSGAYPIGALQKIVYILQQIDPDCRLWLEKKLKDVPELYKQKIINEVRSNPFDYTRKLDVIKNSIFGVDIQPIAVDVSRLRCFLTLVVESEIDDTKPNRGIEPLPNLDFKFVCANTLIGLPKSQSSNLFEDHSGITELSGIMSEYFSCNSQRKNEIKLKFSNTQKDILNRTLSAYGKNIGELTQKLTLWDPFNNKSNSWFDPEWMFGLEEKFDVVIGNPPYVSTEKITEPAKSQYKSEYSDVHAPRTDLYVYFYNRGLELSRKDTGLLCYITSNKWMRAGYGEKLRAYFASKNPLTLIDLGSGVFESATVDSNVLILQNTKNKEELKATILSQIAKDNIKNFFERNHESLKDLSSSPWSILSLMEQRLKRKIDVSGIILKKYGDVKISFGIKTGLNKAFIVDENIKDSLISEDSNSIKLIKPLLSSPDIKSYTSSRPKLYIILVGFGMYKELPEKYPAIYRHLLQFKSDLQKRGQCIGSRSGKIMSPDFSGQHHWLELDNNPNSDFFKEFEKDKIVWRQITTKPTFCIALAGTYIYAPSTFLTVSSNLEYILGILNSNLVLWYYSQFAHNVGGIGNGARIEWKKVNLEKIPIPEINSKNSDIVAEIKSIVLKIVTQKTQDPKANTQPLETQIDHLVYQLYNLTPEEIEIIEGK